MRAPSPRPRWMWRRWCAAALVAILGSAIRAAAGATLPSDSFSSLLSATAATDDKRTGGLQQLTPPLERGMIYVQPSYHFTNNLDLDLNVLRADLDLLAARNFSNIGLRVSWGALMARWNPANRTRHGGTEGAGGTPTWNETICTTLGAIGAEAVARGLQLIFNVHLLDTVPQGVPGAEFVPSGSPDIFNVSGGDGHGVWRSAFLDAVVRDEYREPILLFHEKFASCLAATPGAARFWKHAFESTYLFPLQVSAAQRAAGAVSAAEAKFSQWARASNASIAHWAARWREPGLASFDDVTIPAPDPAVPSQARSKEKYGDFWRFWLLGVLKEGRFNGVSVANIADALRRGAGDAYNPALAYKHWRPTNLETVADLTMDEVVQMFDLPINATALGYYVNTRLALANEPTGFVNYIRDVKRVAPPALPLIDWETGASTNNLTEAEQSQWARLMMAAAREEGLLGFNWWQWVDWAPRMDRACKTVTECQLYHFGAHFYNGTAKDVWRTVFVPLNATRTAARAEV